tara:strand:- start:511 stop:1065 length:555 start_codon:yes stop_codon:yes gene_type:complete
VKPKLWKSYIAPLLSPGRQFCLHALDVPSERFGALASFVEIWRGKWRDGKLPPWSAFDFYDFAGWHGWIHIDEIVSVSPFEMRCRLWGTELVNRLGVDETGKLLSFSPAVSEPNLIPFYRDILALPAIGTNAGIVTSYGRASEWSVVKLPCPGHGAEPDVILSCSMQGTALAFPPEDLLDGRPE